MTTSTPFTAPASVEVLTEPHRASAALNPERHRLLEALQGRPDSASGLARRLGDSRQRLNYHLRGLQEAGLVEVAEERRKGNCVERLMRPVARRFVLDPAALGELAADPGEIADRFSVAYLIALAARAIRELAALWSRARREGKRLGTAGLDVQVRLARPADFPVFVEDLSRAIGRVVAKHHDERAGGRPFRVIAGVYPASDGEESRAEKGVDR